jgi:endonuclease/exonuclease/phosphatase family metal-dependent hydrolase
VNRRIALLALAALGLALRCHSSRHHAPVCIATFNIEEFPKDARQVAAAFDEIAASHASIVGLQEIGDARLAEATARSRLGGDWRFVYANTGARGFDTGVLYDAETWTLVDSTIHDETRLGRRHKPTLEVTLEHDGTAIHVFVVHLKSGGDSHAIRARQLAALTPIVRATDGNIVVLGDFNATGDDDRSDLAALARATGLVWATEPLACSAYWSRSDGCPSSRLDHILSSRRPTAIEAGGACAIEGCEWRASCPVYTDEVSDHCPVVARFE